MFDNALWALFKFISVIIPLIVGKAGAVFASAPIDMTTDGFALQLAVIAASFSLVYFFANEYNHGRLHIKGLSCIGLLLCTLSLMLAFIDLAQKNGLSKNYPAWGYQVYSHLVLISCGVIFVEMIWQFISEIADANNQEKSDRKASETNMTPPECGQCLTIAGKCRI